MLDVETAKVAPTGNWPSISREEAYERDILTKVQASDAVSQRSIAREMGIALGLANLILRRMADKGLIRLVRIRPNRVLYLITPAGIAEKARMTAAYVVRNVQSYREIRDRIRSRFTEISREVIPSASGEKSIVFYGAGEVAEIGYVCLQDCDLRLVGAVDERPGLKFFGHTIRGTAELADMTLAGQPFSRLVVMSLSESPDLLNTLGARGVAAHQVSWLL